MPAAPTSPDAIDEPLDPQLAAVAAAILDGAPVDWLSCDSSAAPSAYSEELRIVADIAAIHRSASDESAEPLGFPPSYPWTVGHLIITAPLGHGTFGEVFRAWDTQLHRDVALKLLYPRSGRSDAAVPTLDEGRLLARVRHPNVVAVYAAERIDERVGLITEFVDGTTLSQIVAERGPLSAAEATPIAIDLCRALGAVHAAGLLHRDIKPQNVMRDRDNRIVLMDFGAGQHADAAPTLAGTPLYLSPEILDGGAPTPQSDVYSLGVLLHYLVTGAYPVAGAALAGIRNAHQTGARTLLRTARRDLPRAFADAVDRATDPDPRRRHTSARAFEDSLMRRSRGRAPVLAAVCALAIVAMGASGTFWWTAQAPLAGERFHAHDWVLVTDFVNETGEAQFHRTLQHAVADELSNSTHVNVASRERVRDTLRLMARSEDTVVDAAIGREVAVRDGGIRLLIAGRVERLAGKYALTSHIIDPSTGTVLASRTNDARDERAVRGAVRDIASWIRRKLGESPLKVDESLRQLEKVTTPSLRASQLYSDAYDAGGRGRWKESEELVRAALDQDPSFASAHIWLAWSLLNSGRPAEEYLPSAQRAFDLAAQTAERERYFIRGSYYSMKGEHESALAAYEALVRLHPDHYWGLNNMQRQAEILGRPRETFAPLIEPLAATRPNSFSLQAQAAQAVLGTWDLNAALPYVERARALISTAPRGHPTTAWIELFPVHQLWTTRRPEEAAAALESMGGRPQIEADSDWAIIIRSSMHLTLGHLTRAEQSFARLRDTNLRAIWLAITALSRNDARTAAAHMRLYSGVDLAAVSVLIRAGDFTGAQRLLVRIPRAPGHSEWSAAEIQMASGHDLQGRHTLQEGVRHFGALPGVRTFYYSETLADTLERAGELSSAIQIREGTGTLRERLYTRASHNGFLWMRNQKRLAELYRTVGRVDDARAIERDLMASLVTADRDHPLLQDLQNLRSQ